VNESPQRLIKLICAFTRCHRVCSNIWTLSWFLLPQLYNLHNIEATNNLGTFWSLLQTQLRQEIHINKLLRRSYTFPFFIDKHTIVVDKHTINVVWKQMIFVEPTCGLWVILKDTLHFCTKRGQAVLPEITWHNWRLSCKKGMYSILGRFFFFCRNELIFGRLTCYDMKSIVA